MILGFKDFIFYFYLLYFFLAIFLAFFIPGNLVLRKIHLSSLSNIVLSPIVGMVLWIYQGVVFGYLGIRWASYLYLIVLFLLWVNTNRKNFSLKNFSLTKFLHRFRLDRLDRVVLVIILIGSFIQISTVWFQGYKNSAGFSFYSLFPDSFYNLALTSSIVRNFPPFEPGASKLLVHNYHYFGNLVIADLVRVFGLPLIQSSYQYLSIFFSVWIGLLGLSLTKELKLTKAFGRWLLFLFYFSGDIIFLLFLILGKGLNFSVNLPEKATTLWVSPPRVFALVILLSGIILFYKWVKNKSFYSGLIMALVFAVLIEVKVYIGIFALAGLGCIGLVYLIKRDFKSLIPLILCLILSLAFYLPVNIHAGGLIFTGFWRIENFAVSSQLGLSSLELARLIYLSHYNYIRVVIIECFYFLLYMYSLGGVFLFGLVQSKRSISRIPKEIHIFLLSGLAVSLICGLFFVQTSGGANTTQFLFSVYIVGSLYTALSLSFWFAKIKIMPLKIILVIIMCTLVSARVLHDEYININNIYSHIGFYTVSYKELNGIDYLKKNTKINTITIADKAMVANNDCYYLVFLTNREFFLCGEGILEDHNIDIRKRKTIENYIFTSSNINHVVLELKQNNISYVYLKRNEYFPLENNKELFSEVFNNNVIRILKVK